MLLTQFQSAKSNRIAQEYVVVAGDLFICMFYLLLTPAATMLRELCTTKLPKRSMFTKLSVGEETLTFGLA